MSGEASDPTAAADRSKASPLRIETLRAIRVLAGDTLALAHRFRVLQVLIALVCLPVLAAIRSSHPSTPLEESLHKDALRLVLANRDPAMVEALRSVEVGSPEPVGAQVPWPDAVKGGMCVRIDLREQSNMDALARSWRRLSGILEDDFETDGRPEVEILIEESIRSRYDELCALQDPWEPQVLHLAARCDDDGMPSRQLRGGLLGKPRPIPESRTSERDISLFAFTAILRREVVSAYLFVALLVTFPLVLSTCRRERTRPLLWSGASSFGVVVGRFGGIVTVVAIPWTLCVLGVAYGLGEGLEPAPTQALALIPQLVVAFASLLSVAVLMAILGLPGFWVLVLTLGTWILADNLGQFEAFLDRRPGSRVGAGLRTAVDAGRQIVPHVRELLGDPGGSAYTVSLRSALCLVLLAGLRLAPPRN